MTQCVKPPMFKPPQADLNEVNMKLPNPLPTRFWFKNGNYLFKFK